MISYELARQLKEAGFPQGENNPQVHTAICRNFDNPDPECRREERGVAPALEELIEACGKDFFQLTLGSSVWRAEADVETNPDKLYGSTPSEAVANLWLVLNPIKV